MIKQLTQGFVICLVLHACSTRTKTWVAIGDSITYLNDHKVETGNRITKGYLTRVVEALPQVKYINKGYNGWTARDVAGKIDDLGLVAADVYTVFLGTNDWWRGDKVGTVDDYVNNTGNSTFFGSYRLIINKVRSLNEKAQLVLITPMQRGDFVYISDMKNNAYGSYMEKNGQSLAQFADAVIAIGQYEKAPVVDLYNKSGMTHDNMVKFKRLKDPQTGEYRDYSYPEFVIIPFDPEKDAYPYPPDAIDMTYDGLHPSDKGCEVIAKMIVEVMSK
jgi:lysophospholipase L1-like esterase